MMSVHSVPSCPKRYPLLVTRSTHSSTHRGPADKADGCHSARAGESNDPAIDLAIDPTIDTIDATARKAVVKTAKTIDRRPYLRELIYDYRRKVGVDGRPIRLGPVVRDSAAAAQVLTEFLSREPVEIFGVLCLTTRRRVICWHEVGRGRLGGVHVDAREVFQLALSANAAHIILAHNHPSGEPHPSADDVAMTRHLAHVGLHLGIRVLDHLIIGDGEFVSLRAVDHWSCHGNSYDTI